MLFGRGRFLRLVLLLLVGVLLLGAAGRLSYRAGWAAGQVAATGETAGAETAPPPAAPRPAPFFGWGFGLIGWFVAGLLKFFFFLMLLGLGFKLLFGCLWRRGAWRRHGKGHHGPPWRGRRHGPPWHGPEGREPKEKSPEDVEPEIRSA